MRSYASFLGKKTAQAEAPKYGWLSAADLDLPMAPILKRVPETPMHCGLEANQGGGSRISCGIPLYKDWKTQKEVLLPVYHTPNLERKPEAPTSFLATAFPGGTSETPPRAVEPNPGKLDFETAIVKIPRNGDYIDKDPKETSVVCGVEPGDGKIACGIPLYKDEKTGAPFILPIYRTPKDEGQTQTSFGGHAPIQGASGSTLGLESGIVTSQMSQAGAVAEAKAKLLKVQTAAKLKEEAMTLLKRFLDVAPPTPVAQVSKAGGSALYYPAPDRTAPGGVVVVSPDVYASSVARSAGLAGWPPGQFM